MSLLVNLYGGPGTGKSTTAAGTFCALKQAGVNAELITEYAKDKVWEKSFRTLDNQIYVFGKQLHRIFRCIDQVDVVVTDSPLLLSLHYGKDNTFESFRNLVKDVFWSFNTLNVFLHRCKPYNPIGRMQTEDEAKEADKSIECILNECMVEYYTVTADNQAPQIVAELTQEMLYLLENNAAP